MFRAAVLLSLVWAIGLIASPAWGVSLHGAEDGFNLRFAPPGARVCVVFPIAETKPEDCAGVEVAALQRLYLGGPPLEMALMVLSDPTSYTLLYQVQKPSLGAVTLGSAAKLADDVVTAARRAAPSSQRVRQKNPAVPFTLHRFGNAQVIRIDLLFESVPLSAGPADVQQQTTYAVLGEHGVHCLYLLSSPEAADSARQQIESALGGVRVRGPVSPGTRAAKRLGWGVGAWFGLACLAALVVVVVLIVRRRQLPDRGASGSGVAGGPVR